MPLKDCREKRESDEFPTMETFRRQTETEKSLCIDDDTEILDASLEEQSINQFSQMLKVGLIRI